MSGATALRAKARNEFATRPLCYPGAFDHGACDRILALGMSREGVGHSLAYGGPNSRSAISHWIARDRGSEWLFEQLTGTFRKVNRSFGFQLEGIEEALLLARYPRGPGFTWHLDTLDGITSRRKLSLSIQLSDPEDYVGGDLEFIPDGELQLSRLRGSLIVFPSYCAHRVTPIRRGKRAALIAFIHGPPFR